MPKASYRSTKRLAYALIFIGIAGLLLSGLLYALKPRPRFVPPVNSVAVNQAPSSVKPTTVATASYNVAPTLPKYIAIPSIGISNTRVIQLGVTTSNQIATPDNIYDTGWYQGSAKPGQLGAMFIYGHVSSWTADGVFYNLKELKPGEDIIITRGDGQTYSYQVVETKVYAYNDVNMQTVLSPIQPNSPGLNLMTCTGQVIKGTSEFKERLVVFASLVKG